MVADPEVIPFGFEIRIDYLVVEKLGVLWPPGHAPLVVVEEPAEEAELALLIQNFDLHEVGEQADESLHLADKPCKVLVNLGPEQCLHAAVRELGP